jgi:hypothetical protein
LSASLSIRALDAVGDRVAALAERGYKPIAI